MNKPIITRTPNNRLEKPDVKAIVQGTTEWQDIRRGRLTASHVPYLMDVNAKSWRKIYDKIMNPSYKENYWGNLGKESEAKIFDSLGEGEAQYRNDLFLSYPTLPIGASPDFVRQMDGGDVEITEGRFVNQVVTGEIKSVFTDKGQKDIYGKTIEDRFQLLQKGVIRDMEQIITQMICADTEYSIFIVFKKGEILTKNLMIPFDDERRIIVKSIMEAFARFMVAAKDEGASTVLQDIFFKQREI